MKKVVFSFLCISLLVLLGVSCGGDKAVTQQASGEANAVNVSKSGSEEKTLNVALSENLTTLDPHHANNAPGYQPRNMCFDMLVESDHEGNYTPSLARSWEFSEDGTKVTFHLREDVRWHDGTPFTSADVVCTFQRLIDDRSLNISSIYWVLLKGVEALDDYTVTVILSEPYAPIMSSLSVTAIIQAASWNKQGVETFNNQTFVGTGPWIFDKWIDGQYIHVTKNKDYWGDFESSYDDVYLRIVLEASTAIAAHRNGDVQAYIASSGIASDNLRLYRGSEVKIELKQINTGTVQYFGLQCGDGSVFKNRNARLAFIHAIDRDSIAEHIFGGEATTTDSFAVESVIGHSPDTIHYEYNQELAKEYLTKTDYKGEKIILTSNTGTKKSQDTLLVVSEMLNAVGFNTSVEIVEVATLAEIRATGEYDVFLVATMQENGEPYKYFNMRVLNDAHHSFFLDEELNGWIQESNSEMDPIARRRLLEKCVVRWSEDAVHIPLARLASSYAVDYGVKGIELYQDGLFNFKYVTR